MVAGGTNVTISQPVRKSSAPFFGTLGKVFHVKVVVRCKLGILEHGCITFRPIDTVFADSLYIGVGKYIIRI